jgi:hypothetical protein
MSLKAKVRRELIANWAKALARDTGMEQHFNSSQTWVGYPEAFESWEKAVWQWVDTGLTAEIEDSWRSKLLKERGRFASTMDFTESANDLDMERHFQIYLLRRADFLAGLRHKKENAPAWFKEFGFYFYIGQTLDDDDLFAELARLTKRKTSEDHKGRRSLSVWILRQWIPNCFWAFANDGIIDRLASRNSNLLYSEGSIRNTISKLHLWHPKKPLYWGLTRNLQLASFS